MSRGRPPERPAVALNDETREVEPVLGRDRDRATERVEAEHRVGAGHERDGRDRGVRDEIPVHAVAERFVEAHAVLEHGQPGRRAEQRRAGETAEVDVRLVGIPLRLVDVHAVEAALHEVRQRHRAGAAQVFGVTRLHVRGHLVLRNAQAREGRRRDDLDGGGLGSPLLRLGSRYRHASPAHEHPGQAPSRDRRPPGSPASHFPSSGLEEKLTWPTSGPSGKTPALLGTVSGGGASGGACSTAFPDTAPEAEQ